MLIGLVFPLLLLALPPALGKQAIFQIDLNDLRDAKNIQQLEDVLKNEGALAVTGLGSDYETAVKGLKIAAPSCLLEHSIPMLSLPDGSLRTTLAMSEEEPNAFPFCVEQYYNTISTKFDIVFALMAKLCEDIVGSDTLQWSAEEGGAPQDFFNLLKKEHLHVYQAPEEDVSRFAQPFHTDNGILLMVTPFKEHPLQIRNRLHEEIDTSELADDALIIIVARALPGWLLAGTGLSDRFFAAPHAVASLPAGGQPRTIMARMMVAPMKAVPARSGANNKFENIFLNQGGEQLCLPAQARTVSGWDELQARACPENTAYCWMGCLPLPSCTNTEEYVCNNSAGAACCTESVLGDCLDMDTSCEWQCQ